MRLTKPRGYSSHGFATTQRIARLSRTVDPIHEVSQEERNASRGIVSAGKVIGRLRIRQPPLAEKFYVIGFTKDGVVMRRSNANGDAFIEVDELLPTGTK